MAVSQAVQNGKVYLEERRPIILGISPGNPFFYNRENLRKYLKFGNYNSDKVLMFIPDKISEHNYRAVGSSHPEKSARVKGNSLRNKVKEVLENSVELQNVSCSYVNWVDEVEASREFEKALNDVRNLYRTNDEFSSDIRSSTEAALKSLKDGRKKGSNEKSNDDFVIDIEEGTKYPLKELAFLSVVPRLYEGCEKFLFVYLRPWPVLEKFFDGGYDGKPRPCLGFIVFQ